MILKYYLGLRTVEFHLKHLTVEIDVELKGCTTAAFTVASPAGIDNDPDILAIKQIMTGWVPKVLPMISPLPYLKYATARFFWISTLFPKRESC